ncbi:uncharacterized protein LOC127121735 [Lathyrus oleraceus]|uniref:uncharacterized protein LOC127121735 n=1 Tax=Pisum sativum TaxID=3888 RepID=UPI0021D09EF0|nr:uncharacterized protein LOC127121735 [Pisum sativum]
MGAEIDLFDVITDVVPLSIVPVHATPMRKDRTSYSTKGKPSKVSTFSSPSMTSRNSNAPEPPTIVKKPQSMISLYLDPISIKPNVDMSKDYPVVTNVMDDVKASETNKIPRYVTTLSKSNMIVADKHNIYNNIRVLISQVLGIGHKTNVVPDVSTSLAQPDNDIENPMDKSNVNVPTLSPKLASGIVKRLKNRKDQAIESSITPSKSTRKRASVGPTKRWSKVVTPMSKKKFLKRKEAPSESSEFDHDVEHNVQEIISISRKKQGKDVFECKDEMSLIKEVGLMKIVTGFGKCYEMLVREFIVNISKECDNKRINEFRKVYVRGRCVYFSPEITNRFLGRNEEEQAEIEVSDNVICRNIIVKQVKEWPRKGKLSASALSVKYDVFHRIGAVNWVPTNHISNIATGLGKSKIELLIKALSKEEGGLKGDRTYEEEEENEDATRNDED